MRFFVLLAMFLPLAPVWLLLWSLSWLFGGPPEGYWSMIWNLDYMERRT